MTAPTIFLVEMTWLDANGVANVYRASTASAFMTRPSEVPPNAVYEPRLLSAGSYERHCWQKGCTRGASQIGFGVISLANSDGVLDWMLTAGVDGQSIVILQGPDGGRYPQDFTPYFTGAMRRAAPTWNTVDVYVVDMWGDIGQRSLQLTKFAGTNSGATGVEGLTTDLMGKPKPKLRGTAINFAAPCVNSSSLIYQLDDGTAKLPLTISGGSGPTAYGAFDKRSALTYDGTQASLAALQGATIAAGHFASYAGPDGWYIRLGSTPTKLTVTASEGALSDRCVANIVNRILTGEGGLSVGQVGGVAALAAAASQEVGIWVGEETTLQPLIDSLLDSINGFCVDTRAGGLLLGQLVDPATLQPAVNIQPWMIKSKDGLKITPANDPGVGILIAPSVSGSQDRYLNNQDSTAGLPVWRIKLQGQRNFTVMSGSDLAGDALSDQAFAFLEYRTAIASDPTVLAVHKNAPEFTVNTLLIQQVDMTAESSRQLTVRKPVRYIVEVPLDPYSPLDPANPATTLTAVDLSKGVTLTMPRFGWNTGKTFFCLGIADDQGDATTPAISTLLLWG